MRINKKELKRGYRIEVDGCEDFEPTAKVTCWYCHKVNSTWGKLDSDKKWRLFDNNGNLHSCKKG